MECRKLPAFQPENLRQGFSQDMVTEARKRRKINQVNCTVCQTLYLCSLCMHDSINHVNCTVSNVILMFIMHA